MRPSSETEAVHFLKMCRFTIADGNIKPPMGRKSDDVSVPQADAIDFLCQEHGYVLDDSPQPDVSPKFFDDHQAILFLKQMGFVFKDGVINPPLIKPPMIGLTVEALNYLCNDWDYTYEQPLSESAAVARRSGDM